MTRPSICISGAIPDLGELTDFGWDEADIRLMVQQLARLVYDRNWDLRHGCHPTFTPIIEQEARRVWDGQTHRTAMFVARRFFQDDTAVDAFVARHADYAKVQLIAGPDAPIDSALTELRTAMLTDAAALICLGGRLHRDGAREPGVAEEIRIARERHVPIVPLGGFGGYVSQLLTSDTRSELRRDLDLAGINSEQHELLETESNAWTVATELGSIVEAVIKSSNDAGPARMSRS